MGYCVVFIVLIESTYYSLVVRCGSMLDFGSSSARRAALHLRARGLALA